MTEGESGIRRGERGNGVRAGRAHLPVTDGSSGQVGFKVLTSIQNLSPAYFQKRGPRCPRVSGSLPRGRGSQVRSLKATYGLESQRRWVPRSQNSESKGPEAQPPRGRSLSFTSLHSVSSRGSQAEDNQEVFVKQANEQKKNDLLAASQVLSKVILTQSYRAGVMNSHLTAQEIKFRGVMSFNCSHKAHKGWRQDLNPGPSDSRRCGFDPWSGD